MTDTLILGGGLASCTSALWQADQGHSATIVEARPRLGGRAHARDGTSHPDPAEDMAEYTTALTRLQSDATQMPDDTASPQTLTQYFTHRAFPGATLLDCDWHDWCADPFARGTWVSPCLANLPHYALDHWATRGRLAFAGSDLCSAEQGWIEGALLTARGANAALTALLSKA